MKIWSDAFRHGEPVPPVHAFGRSDLPRGPFALSENISPPLAWSDLPAGTLSLALVCHDTEVPTRADDVNQPGRRVPYDLPRARFFHWVLFDLSPATLSLPAGAGSRGITPRGKPGPDAGEGRRHGINDFTAWFAGDAEMKGQYFGYDGPCPPWNDTRLHRYWFTLYALNVARAPVEGTVDGATLLAAIEPHVLGSAALLGTYTIAPDARG